MTSAKPTREQADLAEVLELVLDKGIVINADVAVTVGETELLGVELRAAIASFETAAEYGLAFPSGTDMRRVEQASGREPLEEGDEPIDLGIDASSGGGSTDDGSDDDDESSSGAGSRGTAPVAPATRPTPTVPTGGEDDDESAVGTGSDSSEGTGHSDAGQDDAGQDDAGQDDAGRDDADGDADQDDATREADADTEDA